MKKQISVIVGVWLFFVCFHLLLKDQVFSPVENRYLQERPKWSMDAFIDGSFGDELESWLLDQLPGRDGWVQIRSLLSKSMGRSENGGVYFGEKQYLLETFQEYDKTLLSKNLDKVSSFFGAMEELGVESHLILVPTAAEILNEYVPDYAPELSQKELLDEIEPRVPRLLRVEDALKAHAQEEIYYRTDHHWTSLGAYYAYASYLEQTGRQAMEAEAYVQEILSRDFYGTSYAKAGLYSIKPDAITAMYPDHGSITVDYGTGVLEDTLYDRSFLSKRDQYRVFLKGNYPLTTIRTDVKNGKKLLLVKDSYANTFVQFLISDYEEIQMVDLRYFHMPLADYAKEQKFTEVLMLYQLKNFAENSI